MKPNQALLIIDAQVNMLLGENPVYQAGVVKANLLHLLEKARQKDITVVFVRNNGGAGSPDTPGSPGWEIDPAFSTRAGDVTIDKWYPDAFKETTLQAELAARGIRSLVIGGMQSEYCIDATSRGAVELGYQVTVANDAHSTYASGSSSASDIIERINRDLAGVVSLTAAQDFNF